MARMLEDHPMVSEVYHPVLDSHPDRYMADLTFRSGRNYKENRKYMSQSYRGMISFVFTSEDDNKALRKWSHQPRRIVGGG